MLGVFGAGQVLWSLLWFFLFLMWLMLVFQVLIDIFRSHDLSGGAKALWLLFVVFFPYLGVFIYLIARGSKLHEHQVQAAHADEDAFRRYIQNAAGTSASPSEELSRLADLKDRGVIDDAEFQRLKARVVG
jgi:hypothetical protein